MRAERFVISDRSWRLLEPLLPGSLRTRGVTAKDNRLFLEAVLWKVRVGGLWRDLPPGFGAWNSVFRRFRRWAQADVFQRIFDAISGSLTLNTSSLMAPSSARIRRRAAQKGDSKSSDRALERRADDEGSGADRRAWQSGALCASSRSAQRNYRGAGPDRRVELQRPDGLQSV